MTDQIIRDVTEIAAQGDLIVRRVERVPAGYEPSADRVIAHSETGHHHVAVGECTVHRNADDAMRLFIVARQPVTLEHLRPTDTHHALRLLNDPQPEIGETVWEIRRQREMTPEGWARVED
jgi:hypothetical protein